MQVTISKGNSSHIGQLLTLYREVAKIPDGIIRESEEVDEDHIRGTVSAAEQNGLILVALAGSKVVGEIHAITPNIQAFRHLLTDLTIAVSPDLQGQGIGKKLFTTFLDTVQSEMPHVLRVELFTREHNLRNIRFYESLGFVNEGRQDRKILLPDHSFHTPIHMAWFNPAFNR